MGNQPELTRQSFPIRDCLIPHIRMGMSPNETRQVTWPDIMLAKIRRRSHTKGLAVNRGLGWGLVMTAHERL
jgi:hypothetical protein